MNILFVENIFKIHKFQGQIHVWAKSAKMCYKHEFQEFQLMLLF